MKYLFAFLISILIFIGCGETKEEHVEVVNEETKYEYDTLDIQTEPVSDESELFLMRYKFNKDKTYNYRLTTSSSNNQTIESEDTTFKQTMSQTIVYLIKVNLVDVDADTTSEADITITSVKVDGKADDRKFSYESGTMNDSASRANFSEFASVINNPFRVRFSKTGEILEISRVDRLVNEFLRIKGYEDSVTVEEKGMIKREMSEGALRPLMINIFRNIPAHPVSKDSTWKLSQPASNFMAFKLQHTYLYSVDNLEKMNDDKIAVLNAGIQTTVEGDRKYSERNITFVFNKPVTEAEGKIYFNIDKGYVQKSRTQTKFMIDYTMEISGPQGKQTGKKHELTENKNIVELLN
jgi:hypothetical protein